MAVLWPHACVYIAIICPSLLCRSARISSDEKRAHASTKSGVGEVLYAIGDSHGDYRFFAEQMISTGKFDLDSTGNVVWNKRLTIFNFQVVLLGDYIDRGSRGKRILCTLMALKAHDLGSHLVPLLGNHESMWLRFKWDHDTTHDSDLPPALRKEAFGPRPPPEAYCPGFQVSLIDWLTSLPVVYSIGGILFCHGGLSLPALQGSLAEANQMLGAHAVTSGQALLTYINMAAQKFYKDLRKGVQGANSVKDAENRAQSFQRPAGLSSRGSGYCADAGVLWFRGYTAIRTSSYHEGRKGFRSEWEDNAEDFQECGEVDLGADERESCGMAHAVAKELGLNTLVMAHTTHPHITAFCEGHVFAIDVSSKDCVDNKDGECDMASQIPMQKIKRQAHLNEMSLRVNAPASLRVPIGAGDMAAPSAAEICMFERWSRFTSDGSHSEYRRGCHQEFATRATYMSEGFLFGVALAEKQPDY